MEESKTHFSVSKGQNQQDELSGAWSACRKGLGLAILHSQASIVSHVSKTGQEVVVRNYGQKGPPDQGGRRKSIKPSGNQWRPSKCSRKRCRLEIRRKCIETTCPRVICILDQRKISPTLRAHVS